MNFLRIGISGFVYALVFDVLAQSAYPASIPQIPSGTVGTASYEIRAELRRKSVLANMSKSCDMSYMMAATNTLTKGQLSSLISCKGEVKAGESMTMTIFSVKKSAGTDGFYMRRLLFELPEVDLSKEKILEASQLRLFYSDCHHAWTAKTGCKVGESAKGKVKLIPSPKEGENRVSIDIELSIREIMPSNGEFVLNANSTMLRIHYTDIPVIDAID